VERYPLHVLGGGGVEQDPEDWWDAVVRGTRCVLGEAGVDPGRVVGVACSSQWSGTVPVDDQGVRVGPRPKQALAWNCFPLMPRAEWQETKETLASLLSGGGQDSARRERAAELLVDCAVSPHRRGKHQACRLACCLHRCQHRSSFTGRSTARCSSCYRGPCHNG
jgi:hypothetical protein